MGGIEPGEGSNENVNMESNNGNDSGLEEEEEHAELTENGGDFEMWDNSITAMVSSHLKEKQSKFEADLLSVQNDIKESSKQLDEAESEVKELMDMLGHLVQSDDNDSEDVGMDLEEEDTSPGLAESVPSTLPASPCPTAPPDPPAPTVLGAEKEKTAVVRKKRYGPAKKVVEPRSYTPPPPVRGQRSTSSLPVGPLVRPELSEGCRVWAMRGESLTQPWTTATVSKITRSKLVHKNSQIEFVFDVRVVFEDRTCKDLTGKQVAIMTESPVRLPVGTRVIALYKEEGSDLPEEFYPAVIAETLTLRNRNRYMVFYDDQYPAYVNHKDVRLVYSADSDVWNDVDPGLRNSLRDFLFLHPNHQMLELKAEDKVKTELNGSYVMAEINYVDASLAQVSFSDACCQWIYRGSTRFEPMLKVKDKVMRERLMGERVPVEIDLMEPQTFVEHYCGPHCLEQYVYHPDRHRGSNPLRIPLHLGWRREIRFFSDKEDSAIVYAAPCGRKCRNIEEVQEYLTITDSNLEIDFFAFDKWVDVMQEFHATPDLLGMLDFSFGKETAPLPAANTLDGNYPKMIKYSTVQIPQKGVEMSEDPGFLVRCNCDNKVKRCDDITDCACRKLTFESTGSTNTEAGYRHRRLYQQVVTGIYECNRLCSCSSTCPNRLAQFPIRTRLQLFKTKDRGWGIRARDDIPQGTFICTYVGKLYTEEESQEQGAAISDEYFAELDLIEMAEKEKKMLYEEDPNKDEGMESDDEHEDKEHKKEPTVEKNMVEDTENTDTVRNHFGPDHTGAFVMDANTQGNVGRYFNHSCSPNIYPQNVFIESHDLRFHTIAFFSFKYVRAGEELCWDYAYEVGSVPGKNIKCNCGAQNCKGDLL